MLELPNFGQQNVLIPDKKMLMSAETKGCVM